MYLAAAEIAVRVRELGAEIASDYDGREPLLVAPLKSSAVFLADLSRALPILHAIDLIELAGYGDGLRGGVRLLKDLDTAIDGRHVLLVSDVVDTGLTLAYLMRTLAQRGPASIAAVALLDRPYRRLVAKTGLRYVGFTVPDELFAGYDYLRGFTGPALEDELSRLLESLHNLNLQRVDRMTMAHSLEARVPFLSTDVVERMMRIHPVLKHSGAFGEAKGLLRSAFAGCLPSEILWRTKLEFAQGSSVSDCVGALASARISEREWTRARRDGLPVESREELYYYNILRQRLRTPWRAGTIGRWQGPVL